MPPGTYLKWYNLGYSATTLNDRRGNSLPAGLDLAVVLTTP